MRTELGQIWQPLINRHMQCGQLERNLTQTFCTHAPVITATAPEQVRGEQTQHDFQRISELPSEPRTKKPSQSTLVPPLSL